MTQLSHMVDLIIHCISLILEHYTTHFATMHYLKCVDKERLDATITAE